MINVGERIAITYFEAFKAKNPEQMSVLYRPGVKAIFTDPVFQNLNSDEVAAMWNMLLRGAKDLNVNYKILSADETSAEVEWVAYYTYSPTKRKVKNSVRTKFVFEKEQIASQTDSFDLCAWTDQALPPIASQLFCWFPNYTIRKIARSQLTKHINKSKKLEP